MYVKPMGKGYQLRVIHKLLPKPYYDTFPSEDEARIFGARLEKQLNAGLVPPELREDAPKTVNPMVREVVNDYEKLGPVTAMDQELMRATAMDFLGVRVSELTAVWVDHFVQKLKLEANNSPGTIRKKVSMYGRILHWYFRRITPEKEHLPNNPFRNLPRGYSTYTKEEARALAAQPVKEGAKPRKAKKDVQRERRLSPDEFQRVKDALQGKRLAIRDSAYPRVPDPELEMLVDLIVDTGLRQREAYTLRKRHLQLDRGFTHVDGTKGKDGAIKPRIVPLKPLLIEKLRKYTQNMEEDQILFHWWDGTQEGKDVATDALLQVFRRLFTYCKVPDFKEHDMRHEACCRWFELRDKNGRWVFSDVEICKIMGWSDYSMVLRYASIRGEDLASRMHVA